MGEQIGTTEYGVDIDACQQACKTNEDCQWFSYDTDGGACYTFNDCPSMDSTCATCLSSQKQCWSNSSQYSYKIISYLWKRNHGFVNNNCE